MIRFSFTAEAYQRSFIRTPFLSGGFLAEEAAHLAQMLIISPWTVRFHFLNQSSLWHVGEWRMVVSLYKIYFRGFHGGELKLWALTSSLCNGMSCERIIFNYATCQLPWIKSNIYATLLLFFCSKRFDFVVSFFNESLFMLSYQFYFILDFTRPVCQLQK